MRRERSDFIRDVSGNWLNLAPPKPWIAPMRVGMFLGRYCPAVRWSRLQDGPCSEQRAEGHRRCGTARMRTLRRCPALCVHCRPWLIQ